MRMSSLLDCYLKLELFYKEALLDLNYLLDDQAKFEDLYNEFQTRIESLTSEEHLQFRTRLLQLTELNVQLQERIAGSKRQVEQQMNSLDKLDKSPYLLRQHQEALFFDNKG